MATVTPNHHVPRTGPKRAAADEEEMAVAAVAKAEAVRAQAAERLYKSAVLQNKKKQAVAQTYTPPNCTFKPKLAASSRRRRSAVAGKKPAHERMYQQAKQAQQKKVEIRKKLADPKNFQPKMASKSTRKKLKSKSEDFLSRLAKDGAARKARERKIREVQEKKADLRAAGYTFKPSLSKKAKSVRSPSPMQRVTDYKKQAAEKEAKRRALQAKYELENCSFKPKMTRSRSAPKSSQTGSFLQRQKENEARAKARMNRLLLEKEEKLRKSETFKPQVKVKSEMLRSGDERPTHERLYESGSMKMRTRKLSSQNVPLDAECTFKPKVRRSKSAPRARVTSGEPIHERLYGERARQAEFARKAKMRRDQEILKDCTFKPKLNKAKNVGSSVTNSDEPIWERLNIEKDKKDRIAKEKEKQKNSRALAECTFKPQVKYHPAHETFAAEEPIWERLHAEPIGFSAEEPTGADQETFQPQINELSEQIVSGARDDSEEIHERLFHIDLKEKERQREEEKAKRELAACTFKPERASVKNKEVKPQDDGTDVFERLITRETESLAAKRVKSPPASANQTPKARTTGTPSKARSGAKASGGGLSFLERMAQASAKQKSAHNTPRGPGGPGGRSPAPSNMVRHVQRPTPTGIPKARSAGHEMQTPPAALPRAVAEEHAEEVVPPAAENAASFEEVAEDEEYEEADEHEVEVDEEFEEEEEVEEEEEEEDDDDDDDMGGDGGGEPPLEF